jgi:hypothetical protein
MSEQPPFLSWRRPKVTVSTWGHGGVHPSGRTPSDNYSTMSSCLLFTILRNPTTQLTAASGVAIVNLQLISIDTAPPQYLRERGEDSVCFIAPQKARVKSSAFIYSTRGRLGQHSPPFPAAQQQHLSNRGPILRYHHATHALLDVYISLVLTDSGLLAANSVNGRVKINGASSFVPGLTNERVFLAESHDACGKGSSM